MAIRTQINGDLTELFVNGRVDGAAANDMEVQVINTARTGAKTILINFAEANFLCSAAIRVLLQYHRQMKSQQRTLLVSRVSSEVDSILEMTGFRDLLVEKAR